MERNDSLAVVLIVALVVFGYSLVMGGDIVESAVAGGFLGVLVALLLNIGLEKIRAP